MKSPTYKQTHLDFDFTGAMVDAAHETGVKAPIYITSGWSHKDAMDHLEWIQIRRLKMLLILNLSVTRL